MDITVVGAGRAGSSFATALRGVGHRVETLHHDELERVGSPDLVLLAVPDDAIAVTSRQFETPASTVVAHVAGSRGLDELATHERRALLHPLAALTDAERGAARLLGATYSVAGDELASDVVASLHGRVIRLSDAQRALYHATASVAANHLVALLGQVQVLAEAAGLTLEDFLPLAEQALSDVERLGVERALTGPASRADMATIDAHLAAIPESQRAAYVALANLAFELAEQRRISATA